MGQCKRKMYSNSQNLFVCGWGQGGGLCLKFSTFHAWWSFSPQITIPGSAPGTTDTTYRINDMANSLINSRLLCLSGMGSPIVNICPDALGHHCWGNYLVRKEGEEDGRVWWQKISSKIYIKKKKITFDSKEQIDDPNACITSTAEPTASFTLCMSACWLKRIQVSKTMLTEHKYLKSIWWIEDASLIGVEPHFCSIIGDCIQGKTTFSYYKQSILLAKSLDYSITPQCQRTPPIW